MINVKAYLYNIESYYYVVKKLQFKRLYLKYANFVGRFKQPINALYGVLNSCEELIVDITPYKEIEDYEEKLLPLYDMDIKLVSQEEDLDIPFRDESRLTYLSFKFSPLTERNLMLFSASLNIPIHYYHINSILYGGWSFYKDKTLKYAEGNLINCGFRDPKLTKTDNLHRNLEEVKKYFEFLEAL